MGANFILIMPKIVVWRTLINLICIFKMKILEIAETLFLQRGASVSHGDISVGKKRLNKQQ